MKKQFSLLLILSVFWSGNVLAQTEETENSEQTISQTTPEDKADVKVKIKRESTQKPAGNVYSNETPKPESPFATRSNNDIGGFTVTKYKESKTKKKLRRGEGRSRMSVPDPKGKPLKHKKKRKPFFGKR